MLATFSANPLFSWSALGWALLYFWYFSTVLQIVVVLRRQSGGTGFRDSLLYSTLWLIPALLFPDYMAPLAAVIGVILWVGSVGALVYYMIYGSEFSQSVLFIMFESNPAEAGEYFKQYFRWPIVVALLAYTAVAVYLWNQLEPIYLSPGWRIGVSLLILYVLFGEKLRRSLRARWPWRRIMARLMERMEPAAPWQLVIAYCQYRAQLANLQQQLDGNSAIAPLEDLQDKNGDTPRTVVLVLGESTQRNRMSLYGYHRQTTPELDALAASDPNLTVFTDVVSARPYTIEIMQQILSFADEENPDLYLTQPSLMNMMKQAGYTSFWITNQQTMTQRNTMLTVFSRQTDHQYYLNNQRRQKSRQYDEVVLAPFAEALAHPAEKKFIVVHLLGTHLHYKYRFPESYARFSGNEGLPPSLDAGQIEAWNDYDNANLYNDFVVSSLVKTFRDSSPNGLLVFFSDHGEEVFDTPPHTQQGRDEYAPTRPMYEVPFFIWQSPQWAAQQQADLKQFTDRKLSLTEFIHGWSELVGVSYRGWQADKSLINPAWQPRPRWIGDPYQKNGLREFDSLPKTVKPGAEC
ncbi:phosphoethanolamine transferase CptA [Leminorella grimontii]|uniref:phosphoethanolamine transferase CptA n=1 Tax=Leminorella grimontii TaxID=82981 RepID=UPI0032208BCA